MHYLGKIGRVFWVFLFLLPVGVQASAIDDRVKLEWETYDNPFAITPHRPTYILPIAYTDNPNSDPYEGSPLEVENNEIKMQFSFKVPLLRDWIFGKGSLSFGYTQRSFWQAYNGNYSSPFRENNYEPEILFSFPMKYNIGDFRARMVTLSLNHQSNGRSEPQSRSWNRVMMQFVLEHENTYIGFQPWWRIPEDEEEDDNPDIEDHLGNFELRVLQKLGDHSLGMMLRNNLDVDENKGAVQLDYTFPLNERLKGYVQYFDGYGESMIDYDHAGRRLGIGIMLTDWL